MEFVCKLCDNTFKNFGMPSHITRSHDMSVKDYYDKYIEPNTEHKCEMCGKLTNFISLSFGYRQYCCQNCSRKATVIKTREKYGVTNISQVPHISKKMRKSIKEDWDTLTEEQYNLRCKHISEGTSISMKSMHKRIHKQVDEYCVKNNYVRLLELIDKYGSGFIQNDILDLNIICYMHNLLVPIDKIPIIEEYSNMKVRSKHETYLYKLIHMYYPDAVQNARQVIPNRELDIFIPSINLAIEYNGNYYHSVEHGMDIDFHLKKSIDCREKGIRLIHIYHFEDYNEQVKLLISLFEGNDLYPKNDFNKNNLIDNIPKPEIIYKTSNCTVYGAGKLY